MYQDLLPNVYHNEFINRSPAAGDAVLLYCGKAPLVRRDGQELYLPRYEELPKQVDTLRYAFAIDEQHYYICIENTQPFGGYEPVEDYRDDAPARTVFACAVGESLRRFYQAKRYCGRCGTPMQDSTTERARVCPACGLTSYPKICPAVIVAVTDGERLLLTKYKNRPYKRYALVAGFNEIGESIEETVRREVHEETGVAVKNLRFYKSQPWAFTDTLLMGFICELSGSDAITVQEDELSEAGWHLRSELPVDHSPISLTGEMIEAFRNRLF